MKLRLPSSTASSRHIVYVVDNAIADLQLARHLCEAANWECQSSTSADDFLDHISSGAHGCLLSELELCGSGSSWTSGIELYREVCRRGLLLTTIIWARRANASSCRAAFQAGAFDFVDKGIPANELQDVLRRALEYNQARVAHMQHCSARRECLGQLSQRELQVARLLSKGQVLKEIGLNLRITVQTASKHRSRIFSKLGVANEVELHQVMQELEQTGATIERVDAGKAINKKKPLPEERFSLGFP